MHSHRKYVYQCVEAHSRFDSSKSLASGTGNFSESRLMPQLGRVGEVVCA